MMTTTLFSIFDPSTTIWAFNWTSIMIPMIFIPYSVWLISSRSQIFIKTLTMNLNNEFNTLMNNKKNLKKTPFILITLMLFIAMNNFMGLFPYIFTSTSHIMITMMMALPMWLTAILYGWINNTIYMWAHMVPQGTPKPLMVFMVCIETTSVMIRPITLAVRLAANMIAGHLLMSLLGEFIMNSNMIQLPMLLIQNLLLILESAVAIIQSYVFMVLVGLYITEAHH